LNCVIKAIWIGKEEKAVNDMSDDALIKILEIYSETNDLVSQQFYQGLCIKAIERIKELEAEIDKRPARPLFGEARSRILQAMDNSAHVDDAIEKYDKLQERITELESVIQKCIDAMKGSNCLEQQWLEKALKGK